MKKLFIFSIFIFLTITLICSPSRAFAQQQELQKSQEIVKQEFSTGTVIQVVEEGYKTFGSVRNLYQKVKIRIDDEKDKGKVLTIESGGEMSLSPSQEVKDGDKVILMKMELGNSKTQYFIYDKFRLPIILYIAIAFFLLVLAVAGWKGLGSLVGLAISLAIIFLFIVPQILSGSDPLMISIIGSLAILLLTTYLAHGFSKQTTVALISTFIALMISAWLSSYFVQLTHLTGLNEETITLQFGLTKHINLQGLLLGGIIIGTLGALNDITTTQAATIFELAKHSTKIQFEKLFLAGFRVGREHIVSLVNTLVLAYAGASLALFLFLVLNPQKIPFWVMVNSEEISDEIIRTLAGSMGLILAVPIVTVLATSIAIWLKQKNNENVT